MKTLYLFLLIFPLTTFCQNEGSIGPFILGKSTLKLIENLANEKGVKIKQSTELRDILHPKGPAKKKTTMIYLLAEGKDKYSKHSYFINSPIIKTYFIDFLEISTVPFEEVYFKFINDTLYEIHSKSSNLIDEAMTLKFGKPVVEEKRKKVECVSRLAGNFNLEEYSYTTTWKIADTNNVAYTYIRKYFDYKCEERFTNFFSFYWQPLILKAHEEEFRISDNKGAEDEATKKKRLSGF